MVWLRPHEFSPDVKPQFLDDGAETGDVIQGAIGDCWFIGALSVLATQDQYIRGSFKPSKEAMEEIDDAEAKAMGEAVYPPMFHYLRSYGMYVIRFFKNYKWRWVIIDDRLPCDNSGYSGPELIFAKCKNKHELWVPIIEKAYAKIHNCYEALISGFVDDALTDMTGLVSEKIKL